MLPIQFPGVEGTIYGGFWRRFGAALLDVLIMIPWIIFISYFDNASRLNQFYTLVPGFAVSFFLQIYCVKRWGGSPGKLITKLKIVKVNGKDVSWREAILRQLITFLLGLPMNAAFIIVLLGMTDEQFNSMAYWERVGWMSENMPSWYQPSSWVLNAWVWGELIVLLCNKRKRALHDFVAGTVVIKKEYEQLAKDYNPTETPMTPVESILSTN